MPKKAKKKEDKKGKEIKEEKEEIHKKKFKEEDSSDWFSDHESYDEDEESKEEKEELTEEELREIEVPFEEDTEFSSRMMRFLTNQKKDVSLENMLDLPEEELKRVPAKKKEDENSAENHFDYMAKPEIDQLKYQAFEPDTEFSKGNLTSTEAILEEQKQLYKHFKTAGGEMIGNNKSEWNPVTPEGTKRKDYLTKKKFTTGPY